MSKTNCPFCKARHGSPFVKYDYFCGTTGDDHLSQVTWRRTSRCYNAEITALRQLLAEVVPVIQVVAEKRCCGMHLDIKGGVNHRLSSAAQNILPKLEAVKEKNKC